MSARGKRVWYAPWRRRSVETERRALGEDAFGGIFQRTLAESGVYVSPDTATRVAAVFACVRVLAESVASLPLFLYRREGRARERATDHPLFEVLHDLANVEATSFEFFDDAMWDAVLRGNAYAYPERDGAGNVRALWPMRANNITVERVGGVLRYLWNNPDGSQRVFLRDEILHLRGPSRDGILGLCVTDEVREAIGLAVAAEAFGARYFANDSTPGGILKFPGKLSDSARERLRKSFEEQHKGKKRSSTAVFEEGLDYQKIGVDPRDSQFLETRQHQVIEVCRVFRVPPHMVMDLQRATFSNIEHQSIEFVEHTLRPWLVRWEKAIYRDLLTTSERKLYFAEFLVDGLLRGDFATRMAGYATGRQWGWLSANEIRERENLFPLIPAEKGGDDYLQPSNMLAPGGAGEEDNDPPEPPRRPNGKLPPELEV